MRLWLKIRAISYDAEGGNVVFGRGKASAFK